MPHRPKDSRGARAAALLLALPLFALAAAPSRAAAPAPPAKASAAPPAADAGGTEGGLYVETVDVNVVNVDVYVTDKKGEPIRGLTEKDFEILENGKPVKITNFYAVENNQAVAGAEPVPVEERIPGVPEKLRIPEDQRLRLVVYVDNFNIRPFNRNRVFKSIRSFLSRSLAPDDWVMLVTYDRSLHVQRPFTSDPQAIASALFDLEKMTGSGIQADSDRRQVLQDIEDSKSVGQAEGKARQYAESLQNDMEFTLDALRDTVNTLAGLPGRKAILYVSDGLPMRAGDDVFLAVQQKYTESRSTLEAMSYDLSRRFQELAAQANGNRVSFYTLDAGGLRVSSSVSAENQTASQYSGLVDSAYTANQQAPLRLLADATGGQAILNQNDPSPGLQRIATDLGNYYSLGYSPSHASDGRYYKVDVRMKKKGLTVRHREGYRDKSADTRMSDGTRASLYFGYSNNPLGMDVVAEDMTRRDDGYYMVQLKVRIPIGKVTMLPAGEAEEARLRLYIGAMDNEGGTSEVQQVSVPIRVPNAEVESAKSKLWTYTVPLLMRAGDQKVAFGLRDEIASVSSFVTKSVHVGG